ncbi:hypothetical protein OS493_029954 [Desmophyllum pertusum]|uniref:Uncharacterized protein n=1 Tax=Desmophyllum pertusum TaxID=174260 RepID=A0A9W9ZY46_9CNID|nr:hypothetical protein OS493_029954 [Desmophyllum pertusum]
MIIATAFRGERLKKLYEFKCACHFYDERTDWDFHAEHCIRCQQLKRDWALVKIAVSAIFSLLYPLVWLSLSFLQSYYYACADVGPPSSSLTSICDVKDEDISKDYTKDYALAVIRSKVIGGVLFVSTLFFLGVFVIIYGEIENYLKKFDLSGNGQDNLQVQVSVVPGRSSGTLESTSSQGNRVPSVTSALEALEAGNQSTNQQQAVDGNKVIYINLSDKFAAALQGSLQDGAWQGIDIRCSQQDENRSQQGSYAPFRPPSRMRLEQEARGEHSYESLHQLT